jgi:16S rRNA processing protein RimM
LDAPGTLLAGEIGKPHGLAGEVYVVPISDDPRRFEPGSILLHADGRELTVESSRVHRNRLLVKFTGLDTRSEAEGLRGALFVTSDDVRDLPEDEFWPHDLIGCKVALVDGSEVGEVADVVPGSAHDFLTVRSDKGESLIPMVKEIVVAVDVDQGIVTLDPPAGLIEP